MNGETSSFRLRGVHVLIILLAFFGVVFSVNAVFITLAATTFTGEEVSRAYVRGLAYNEILAERRAQEALGWSANVNAAAGAVLVSVETEDGRPVTGLPLEGMLRRPGAPERDLELIFEEVRPGVYSAPSGALDAGRWRLSARVAGETPFRLERELWRR